MNSDFAVFILTHGRPDRVDTYKTLQRCGYTGRIIIVIDNEDKTADRYRELYGDMVVVFDKSAVALTFDEGDNTNDRRSVVYARNACYKIAKDLGIKYFLQLDDDYITFAYRMNGKREVISGKERIRNLDAIFEAYLRFYKSIPAVSIAMAQGGDFIGGRYNPIDRKINKRRKVMNTHFSSVDKPVEYIGRLNDDVNTYVVWGGKGSVFIMIPLVSIQQRATQSNAGGLTDLYLDVGTYVKSFYTVMYAPSCVKVAVMHSEHPRLHHSVTWSNAVPYILREAWKK